MIDAEEKGGRQGIGGQPPARALPLRRTLILGGPDALP